MSERVRWNILARAMMRKFKPGDHIAIIGPTGQGKTTLAIDLLTRFWEAGAYCLVLANKPADPLLSKLVKSGWRRIKEWPPTYDDRTKRRIILWPSYGRASTARHNAPIFVYALDRVLLEGGWVVYLDETRYFIEQMGLRQIVDEYWNSARSSKVTLVASAQGPTWINRTMITQESWLFLFRPRHAEDAKLYAEAAGDRKYRDELLTLRPHEFLLVHVPEGQSYISRVYS